MKQVTALNIRRMLDIASALIIFGSVFIDWRAAVVCYFGVIVHHIANRLRAKLDIWSMNSMADAKSYDAQRERGER